MGVTLIDANESDACLLGDRRCSVAVIGAGSMAREHIRAFQDIPGVRVVGIQSRTPERAEGLARDLGVPAVCEDTAALYEATRADLVVVTVPELAANAVSRAAFRHPWTVLMEKPPGYDYADAEAIARATEGRAAPVFVALNRRFLSSTRAAQRDLNSFEGPRYIRVQDQQDLAAATASGQPPLVVENWMYANSIHVIDYLRVFGRGPVTSVEPILRWDGARSRVVLATIRFESGDLGTYEGIWDGPGPWAVAVANSERRWEMRPLEQAIVQNRGERTLATIPVHPRDQQFKPGFRLQAEQAVRGALGMPTDAVTLEQAMETMRLVRDIFR